MKIVKRLIKLIVVALTSMFFIKLFSNDKKRCSEKQDHES